MSLLPGPPLDPDDAENQVQFLNFRQLPQDVTSWAIKLTPAVIPGVLETQGLTEGFVSSISLPEKRSILFLSRYSLDWRNHRQLHADLTTCFSNTSRSAKRDASGLAFVTREVMPHVEHIRTTRVDPNLVQLRQYSRQLGTGASPVMAPGVAISRTSIHLVGPSLGQQLPASDTSDDPDSSSDSESDGDQDNNNQTDDTSAGGRASITAPAAASHASDNSDSEGGSSRANGAGDAAGQPASKKRKRDEGLA